jgi:hypothetical protein
MRLQITDHRLQMIAAVWVLTAGLARGQLGTDTNCWPSQEKPRAVTNQIQQIYLALNERRDVVPTAYPSDGKGTLNAPAWWRTARSELAAYKEWTKSRCKWFVDTNNFVDGKWTNSTAAYPFPLFTVTALCASARIPTNYFEYTPWRGLSGLGPYTNDASVPYPYGWTNAYTLAGGTNFPAGRTNWYTTDYGFSGFTSVVAQLRFTMWGGVDLWNVASNMLAINGIPPATNGNYMYADGTDWADCVQDMEAQWNDSGNWTNIDQKSGIDDKGMIVKFHNDYFMYARFAFKHRYRVDDPDPGVTTNIAASAHIYGGWSGENIFNMDTNQIWNGSGISKFWMIVDMGAGWTNRMGSLLYDTLDMPESDPDGWSEWAGWPGCGLENRANPLLSWHFEY